ncbi:beta-glucosidase BglX [Subsaximicrobium wynnwilliamsii]|uniref:Periplasmic beta-glucosidase n=1 Tax=Subsaximicrobium wynnwilliamsii TaxID=291179 RepID=A0A5C6ZFS6_9FLAO|nr:beta-glucosidase BglX [Subsaximicrobium wynnwilliamsii]TXD81977.1 beta-glucosidase BglX [Subsaximicrobium wynnwilliamsii]TXD87675.1 beta-glucosidase BglX [Subsaximicrobium wynnwilliamsii]TXE01421.1 beta-glucosidase BglX [Subsaximicrobium wynnwilliamsii]
MNRPILTFTIILTFGLASAQSQKTNNPFQTKVDSILKLMTLEEKLGQLNLPSSGDITTGASQSSNVAKNIEEGKVGGLFNIKTVAKIREVQQIAMEKSRMKIPLLFGMDVIHGYETTFPIPLGLSATWDMDMIEKTARMAAQEATADGINWTFSPMTDISRDPRWGRVSEGSGEDVYLGSRIAEAMVKGYQGDDLTLNNTMLACVKHFALYGAPDAGRDYNTVDMSKIRMYNEYLGPYKAAVDAGVASVMAAFNEIDGVPATGNKWLLTDLLREDWGFNGFVVTDYTGIEEMMYHGIGDFQEVSARALKAGSDMDMVSEGFLTTLKKSYEEGKVSMADIDTAVGRILTAKYQIGLFDDPYKYCDLDRPAKEIFTPENRAFARKVSSESMVLLKNDNNLLPLKKSGTIALIGPLSNDALNMAGTWSVATKQEKSSPLLEGLKTVAGKNVTILQAKGSNVDYDLDYEKRVTMLGKEIPRDGRTDKQLLDEALAIAKKADVIVAALGETAEMSGESSSVTNLQIPQVQKDLLNALLKTGKPVVLVLFTGRPLAITEEDENVPAILNVWFPGSEAGLAISDVLFGDVNPSGKLTATFPMNVGQVPIFYNHKNTGRPLGNKEGKFEKFKSNYLDVRNEPLYPFGYGLSYTTFAYGNLKLTSNTLNANGTIEASVEVTNSGTYDGKEVVQLYIRDVVGSVTRPVKELKGFQKVLLKKGETKTISFSISEEDLKFYNNSLEFKAEPGTFQVFIGTDSNAELMQEFELK